MVDEITPKKEPAYTALMVGFLLAAVHQYLFYGNAIGVSYPIFVVFYYMYMLYYSKDRVRKATWFSYAWLGAILLLSLTYVLFSNPFFFSLNLIAIPALIILHMTFMLHRSQLSWASASLIKKALEQLFPQTFRQWANLLGSLKKTAGIKVKEGQKDVYRKVLIGLLISCPLLLVVVSLLSSADGIFNQVLSEISQGLNQISFGEGFIRTFWVVALGLGFFGYLWGFVKPHVPEEKPNKKAVDFSELFPSIKLDPIIATTVLFAVNTVYVLFVVVQFSYLFGAWEGILPEGSSYADYARNGFFELIMVTSINFMILMSTLLLGEKGKELQNKMINVLLYILVACSTVMLYSAYTRLDLYEEAYGYTYIRFLVHAFMLFLGILLIIAGLRIHYQRLPLVKCYILLGVTSYLLMNYIGMDVMIANNNMERYQVSGKLDTDYLLTLSPEATPILIEFSREENGMLDTYLKEEWKSTATSYPKWQSFNLSQYRSQRELDKYFAQ
ncbi:DUF4153 domain-containing protein [Paenibacillus wynnii]|uniref:Uncharacterized protein n=1 Tax=Paenibacillus wynnii TaxID=268407 RepID=A0A098M4U1_9BACL|nr:DUF4173 domain-containing protein [Paenibacillus wynnii]KGE16567.1 hypothetical protein PWYN_17780 [Paenibacillus wynnii]